MPAPLPAGWLSQRLSRMLFRCFYVEMSFIYILFLQDCLPIRVKAIHVVKQPYAFDMFYTIIRPFLKQKLAERVSMK